MSTVSYQCRSLLSKISDSKSTIPDIKNSKRPLITENALLLIKWGASDIAPSSAAVRCARGAHSLEGLTAHFDNTTEPSVYAPCTASYCYTVGPWPLWDGGRDPVAQFVFQSTPLCQTRAESTARSRREHLNPLRPRSSAVSALLLERRSTCVGRCFFIAGQYPVTDLLLI
jgi:hypothetical protein